MAIFNLNPVRHVVLGKKLPYNIASIPVVTTRTDNTIQGSIDIYIEGITGVSTLDTSLYRVMAPTGTITQWSKVGDRLDDTNNLSVGYTGITSDHQRIDWRLDPNGITGTNSSEHYGLSFAVNASAGITGVTYTPDLVVKLYNPIDWTGLTGSFGNSLFGITGPQGHTGSIGLVGATGSAGYIGADGTTGAQGVTGLQGSPDGATGAVGPTGAVGGAGSQGITGSIGPQGTQGDQGLTGASGAQGTTGYNGLTGEQGIAGDQGAQGITGYNGLTGEQGEQGVQGIQGIQGDQGSTGYIGLTGEQGVVGDKGPEGDKGPTGDQGLQGITGEQGLQGFTGEQGLQGIVGDRGLTGADGITGSIGPQGIQGEQGITGVGGSGGDQGVTGLQGETGAGIQGVTGLQGAAGDQGAQGATGVQGETGAQGIQGSKGETGTQGIAGDQGTTGLQGGIGIQGQTGAQGEGLQGITGLANFIEATLPQSVIISPEMVYDTNVEALYVSVPSLGSANRFVQISAGSMIGATGLQGTQGETGSQGQTGAGIQGDTGLFSGVLGTNLNIGANSTYFTEGLAGSTGSFWVSFYNNNHQYINVYDNITVSGFTGPVTSANCSIRVKYSRTNSITWPGTIKWRASAAPTQSGDTGMQDMFVFYKTIDSDYLGAGSVGFK